MIPPKQLDGFSVGTTPPVNPQPGDRWHEVDSEGDSVYGWDWNWNGWGWVSPEQMFATSYTAHTTRRSDYLPLGRKLWVTGFQINVVASSVAQTATNYWVFELFSVSNARVQTQLAALNTINLPVNRVSARTVSFSLGGVLVDGLTGDMGLIELRSDPINSPGNVFGAASIRYQFVR